MYIAKLVLEYLKVLVWPIVVLFVLLHYDEHISKFLKRISEEAEEISTNLFTIKLRERIQELEASIPPEAKETKAKLKDIERDLAIQQFIEIAPHFYSEPLITRMHLTQMVENLSKSLSLSSILHFANSSERGERVGAGIALKQRILEDPSTAESQDVLDSLRSGIRDRYSRVRFRFIEAIGASAKLSLQFEEDLKEIAKDDTSPGVRGAARNTLARMSS